MNPETIAAAIQAGSVTRRQQKGKKFKEEVKMYSQNPSEDTKHLTTQERKITPSGKEKFEYKDYFLAGDTLQMTKNKGENLKHRIITGKKAERKFQRAIKNQ